MKTSSFSIQSVPDFSLARVIVVGDVMLDTYIWGDAERVSPEAPVPVVRTMRKTAVLGGAGNVAANCASLGCQAEIIGVCGTDEAGRVLKKLHEDAGIDVHMVEVPGRPSTTKTRIMARGQQLLRLDDEQTDVLSKEAHDAVFAKVEERLPGAGAVIVSDYAKGCFAGQLAQDIINLCRKKNVPVFVDPKGASWERYHGATCITPNTLEFKAVASLLPDNEDDIRDRAVTAIAAYGLDHLLLTRGSRGMSLFSRNGNPLHIPTEAQEVFDVSGAGDTVIATLATGVAAGMPLETAARLANYAAGIAVGKLGTHAVSRSELVDSLKARELGSRSKIKTLEEAMQTAERWRRENQTVVFTNGCFDLLHVGHISLLHDSAAQGDRLIVGLNSDSSVKGLKGESRPILPESERAALLAALECVDMVVLFSEETPLRLIRGLKPDVLVKGGDYVRETVVGHEDVESWGGRVHLVPLEAGKSTTGLIERVQNQSNGS